MPRLRRLCEVKAKGKLQVPEWLHKKWVNDKDSLAKTFEECGLDKDRIKHVYSVLLFLQ